MPHRSCSWLTLNARTGSWIPPSSQSHLYATSSCSGRSRHLSWACRSSCREKPAVFCTSTLGSRTHSPQLTWESSRVLPLKYEIFYITTHISPLMNLDQAVLALEKATYAKQLESKVIDRTAELTTRNAELEAAKRAAEDAREAETR
jgi:hypothetical protein